MSQLVLLRHLESKWNKANRFTGWTDVPLSLKGRRMAKEVAKKLVGFKFDKVYTSALLRNRETVRLILKELNLDLPVVIDSALDERNYGALTGLNKDKVKKKYGTEQSRLWRRSWSEAPPQGESLKDVYERTIPFFKKNVEKDLKLGKNILLVASHNSLRALVKYLENIREEDIINLELPSGSIREYNL